MKKKLVIGLVAAAIVLATIFTGASALAQTGSGPVSPGSGVYLDSPLLARLAAALGLTPAELSTELGAGKTLAAIALERNVPSETLVEAIIAPHADQLALRVKYGYLTAEQSQALLEAARERASLMLEQNLSGAASGNAWGHCGGNMGGFGPGYGAGPGMMGGWRYNNNNANTPGVNPGLAPRRGWGMMGGGMMGRW